MNGNQREIGSKTTGTARDKRNRNDSGQVLLLVVFSMTTLLGMTALSIDGSFMYDKRNRLHAAADAAAKSGALEIVRNPAVSNAELQTFANHAVTAHGFTPGSTTNVVVNRPPTSGTYAANSSYVEVLVSEATSTFFGGVIGVSSMTPGARAVAGYSNPVSCFILLAATGSSPVSLAIGNSELTLNNCGLASRGDLSGTNPNAEINGTPTPAVFAAGTCSGTCSGMGSLTTGAPPPEDPLEGLAAPPTPNPATCIAGTAATLYPGCYTSIADTVETLIGGGVYYVTGPVTLDGSLTGTNLLLYLAPGGSITAGQNDSLSLTAQATGPYAGIAIFQDPANSNTFEAENHFTLSVSGAIYMPSAHLDFRNHITFAGGGCTYVIAKSLHVENGSGSLVTTACAGLYAGSSFLSAAIAE